MIFEAREMERQMLPFGKWVLDINIWVDKKTIQKKEKRRYYNVLDLNL